MGVLLIPFLALSLVAISHSEPNHVKAHGNFPSASRYLLEFHGVMWLLPLTP